MSEAEFYEEMSAYLIEILEEDDELYEYWMGEVGIKL